MIRLHSLDNGFKLRNLKIINIFVNTTEVMRKEIYLIKGKTNESYPDFSKRIISLSKAVLENNNIKSLKATFTEKTPPKISIIPFKKRKIAAISVFRESSKNVELLINEPGFSGSYLVEEAIPVAYEKKWNDGETTPGICLLTLFQKKKSIDYATFLNRWHNGHTPLSLKIHPLWNYNRNVVKENLNDSSFNWDGVVEEHFRTVSDLMNPTKFFGNPLIMVYNMLRVYFDTNSFLDYKTIEPYYTIEIHIKS